MLANSRAHLRMKWLPFITGHLIACFIVLSWLHPQSRVIWDSLDVQCFRFLNGNLESHHLLQIFWAIANVKFVDIFGALFMSSFFFVYIFDKDKHTAIQRLAQFFYVCIWGEFGILFSKQAAFWVLKQVDFMRDSPTITLYSPIMLSEVVPWLNVKDFSHCSFPSDHALIVMQWAAFVWYFCGHRLGIAAALSAIFFTLPRLIAGAHWLSDALVGSLTMVLVILAWATCTPIYSFLMPYLEKFSLRILEKCRYFGLYSLNNT